MSDTQVWRGIHKLHEEMGELAQVLGKLGPYPAGDHPDGQGPLPLRAQHEIADLYAALDYFVTVNGFSEADIVARRARKLATFKKWVLTGIPVAQEVQA